MPATPNSGLRYPTPDDPADVPLDMERLAGDVDRALPRRPVGAVGNGIANDMPAFQAAFDSLPVTGGTIVVPPGIYYLASSWVIAGKQDVTVIFEGGAWIIPPSGAPAIIIGAAGVSTLRPKIVNPRFRYLGGTNMTMISVRVGASGCVIYEPVLWAYATIASSVDFITIDGSTYWSTVVAPTARVLDGSIGGKFRRLITFTNFANANTVRGGSFTSCEVGVYLGVGNTGVNATVIDGCAFEGLDVGVELAGTWPTGNAGTRIVNCRFESVAAASIRFSQTAYDNFLAPIFIAGNEYIAVPEIINPNNVPYTRLDGTRLEITSPNQPAELVQLHLRASNQQLVDEPLLKLQKRVISSGNLDVFLVDPNGGLRHRSAAAAPPAPAADDWAILHHYSFVTKLIAWSASNAGSSVQLAVGDGAGGLRTVLMAYLAVVRPGLDNTIDLGTSAARWKDLHLAGGVYFSERVAPAAPPPDRVVLYADDDGGGKTRLMARFAAGAPVQVAIQP